jgi:hypothetical protein
MGNMEYRVLSLQLEFKYETERADHDIGRLVKAMRLLAHRGGVTRPRALSFETMVVEAVRGEPVSPISFPVIREKRGNFH